MLVASFIYYTLLKRKYCFLTDKHKSFLVFNAAMRIKGSIILFLFDDNKH